MLYLIDPLCNSPVFSRPTITQYSLYHCFICRRPSIPQFFLTLPNHGFEFIRPTTPKVLYLADRPYQSFVFSRPTILQFCTEQTYHTTVLLCSRPPISQFCILQTYQATFLYLENLPCLSFVFSKPTLP